MPELMEEERTHMRRIMLIVMLGVSVAAGCSKGSPSRATANIEPRSGSRVTGNATFTQEDGTLNITVTAGDLTPGKHGVHIHEKGDCSASNAASVGPRFQPSEHAGDLGNMEVGEDGSGSLTVSSEALTLATGDNAVLGRAIVLSVLPYDPAANPSVTFSILGCGIITAPE
jgi:Cu-Zn family superoxide dismutase